MTEHICATCIWWDKDVPDIGYCHSAREFVRLDRSCDFWGKKRDKAEKAAAADKLIELIRHGGRDESKETKINKEP